MVLTTLVPLMQWLHQQFSSKLCMYSPLSLGLSRKKEGLFSHRRSAHNHFCAPGRSPISVLAQSSFSRANQGTKTVWVSDPYESKLQWIVYAVLRRSVVIGQFFLGRLGHINNFSGAFAFVKPPPELLSRTEIISRTHDNILDC